MRSWVPQLHDLALSPLVQTENATAGAGCNNLQGNLPQVDQVAVCGWAPELNDLALSAGGGIKRGRGRSRASLTALTRQVADHAHLEAAAKRDLAAALKVFQLPSHIWVFSIRSQTAAFP